MDGLDIRIVQLFAAVPRGLSGRGAAGVAQRGRVGRRYGNNLICPGGRGAVRQDLALFNYPYARSAFVDKLSRTRLRSLSR